MKRLGTMFAALAVAAGMSAQNYTFDVNTSKVGGAIPSTMYGIFFEDINYAADGGLYGELVKNRSFEFPQHFMGWKAFGKFELKNDGPFEKNPHYVRLSDSGHSDKFTGLENEGFFVFQTEGGEARIEISDVEVFSEDIAGWLVANEGKLTVALEVTITEELRQEGIARELVNRIQNLRKSSGLEITDKINIVLSKNANSDAAVESFGEYICNQVLGRSLVLAEQVDNAVELDLDEFKLQICISKCEE